MPSRRVTSEIDRFAGLSDRNHPIQLTRIENPDVLNVEFNDRVMKRRKGFTRTHASMLRDCSARLDGVNDYIRLADIDDFDFASRGYIGIVCVLRQFPTGEMTVVSRGTGTGSSRFCQISYDSTINANLGGWRLRVYDSTAASLQNVTLNDGDGSASPVDEFRFIEVIYSGAGDVYTFRIVDEDGAVITSTPITVQTWLSSTDDWVIGANAGAEFFQGNVAEFRLFDGADAPSFAGAGTRELAPIESAQCLGYWKLNDGNGSSVLSSEGNSYRGVVGGEGPEWNSTPGEFIGRTSLEFLGEEGHIHWVSDPNFIFTSTAIGIRAWALSLLLVPRLAPGETSVRDQIIFWAGNNATTPFPLGLRVVSDDLQVDYLDGTSVKTAAAGLTLSSYVNQRMRVVVGTYQTSGAAEFINITVVPESTGLTIANVFTATDNADPSAIAANWSIGRLVTNYTFPQTTSGQSAYCVIDDVAFFKDTTAGALYGQVVTFVGRQPLAFQEQSRLSSFQSGVRSFQNCSSLPLDDGYGNVLETTGSRPSLATLYPEEENGIIWGIGLVEPYEPPEGQMLFQYDRLDGTGATQRTTLAISGTTLYEVDEEANLAIPRAGNLHKGGRWTVTQYASTIYLSSRNGKRPRKWSGDYVDWVGIRAPFQTPVVATAATTGGSLLDGTYALYVTYRNAETGVESNPSPVANITIAAGTGTAALNSVLIPVSTDPQVNQRRIWMTLVGGTAGAVAYLVASIDDNITTAYTTGILQVAGTAATMTYTDNDIPPGGAVVKVFKDRLWVGGAPEYPTRAYFSAPGALDSFNQTTDFVDVDLDSGDAINALETLRDTLIAHFGDGRVAITGSGATADPFYVSFLSKDTGAVGPLAVREFESSHIYVSETDIVLWDGTNSFNVSSPQEADRPSIQRTVREDMDRTRKRDIGLAVHTLKTQIWITYAEMGSSRNDRVLVFNYDQGVWSKYDLEMDVISEIEDTNDTPHLYGISNGFVVKLDDGVWDGHTDPTASGVLLGTHSVQLLQDTTKAWAVNAFRGLKVYLFSVAMNRVYEGKISSNSATALTLYEALPATPANGDAYVIGPVRWYADFNMNFGSPMANFRLKWVKLRGESRSDSSVVRLSIEPNVGTQTMPLENHVDYYRTWASGDVFQLIPVGGVGRNWRIRIGESGITGVTSPDVIPSVLSDLDIHWIEVEGTELAAK